jgi:hypothetical protein
MTFQHQKIKSLSIQVHVTKRWPHDASRAHNGMRNAHNFNDPADKIIVIDSFSDAE